MEKINVKPITDNDRDHLVTLLVEHWGSKMAFTCGRLVDASLLKGFISRKPGGNISGFLTYEIVSDEYEVVTLNSLEARKGIGRALMESAIEVARREACKRIWLVTTNDNVPAMAFYRKLGFDQVRIYPDAMTEGRMLKPEIPLTGYNGIPIRDAVEYELILKRK